MFGVLGCFGIASFCGFGYVVDVAGRCSFDRCRLLVDAVFGCRLFCVFP